MCGICGFNWADQNLVRKMAYAIRHRGPDQEGYFVEDSVSFGHKRLSIIDLSEKGRQPMSNEDGSVWITFNGEIYNHQEIRPDLEKKGHKFISDTDTEVIIHAYEEYGENCLKLFNGMFAFAIWDANKKRLFLARDRFGQKYLYYYCKDGKFLFASEIKALLQCSEIKKEFNESTLSQFITWAYAIDGGTFFKDIYALGPGHYMVYDVVSKSVNVKKYWDLQDNLKTITNPRSEDYYVKRLRDLLLKSVERRLMSDVPLGASLSGGLDSSLVVGMMSHLRGKNIKTYTVGFGRDDDEFPYAKRVADHCGAEYNELVLSFDTMTKSMPQVLWSLEIPNARPAQPVIYYLLKEIQKNLTVNLVGEGADELFSGYNRYQVYAPLPKYSSIYEQSEFNRKWWQNFKRYEQMDIKQKINMITSGYFNDEEERKAVFADEILGKLPEHCTVEKSFGKVLRQSDKENYLNAALCFEGKTSLEGVQLIKLDKLSMASSLEVRAPFLDHNVAEFSMEIPPQLKWNGLDKKYILQKVAREFIPEMNASRKKLPLQVPLMDYYKTDFMEVIEGLLSEKNINKRPYLKKDYVLKLIKRFKENQNLFSSNPALPTSDNALRQLLFLTNLELMQRMFFENDDLKNPSMDINKYIN